MAKRTIEILCFGLQFGPVFYNPVFRALAVTGVISTAGPTILKRPSRPEPVLGPRPREFFFHSFFPPPLYLGSHQDTNMLHVRHRSRSGGQILPLATDSIFLLRYCMASDGPDLKLKKQFDPKFPRAQPLESYPLHEKQRTSLSRHPCPEGSFPLLICMSLWQKDAEYRFFSVRNTYLLVSSRMCFA